MRALGDVPASAHLGPCIRPGCYEFDGPELDQLAGRFGEGVRSATGWGRPALDLPATVRAALAEAGVDDLTDDAPCTACDDRWYSHRGARRGRPLRHRRLAGGGMTAGEQVDAGTVAAAAERIRARIASAGGDPAGVRLVAVTKGRSSEAVRAAAGRRPRRRGRELPAGAGRQGGGRRRPGRGRHEPALALHRAPPAQQGPPGGPDRAPLAVDRPPLTGRGGGPPGAGRGRAGAGQRERRRPAGGLRAGDGPIRRRGVCRPGPRGAGPHGDRRRTARPRRHGPASARCASSPTASGCPSGRWA